MAGFFDKLNKAIGDISKKVEESGIVDDLKDLVGGDESDESSDGATSSSSESAGGDGASGLPQGWDGAVSRAGLDPMKLLSAAEMSRAVGMNLDHSYEQLDDEWFGVTFTQRTGGGPYVDIRFAHGYTDGSPVDVPGLWQFVTLEVGATTPAGVPGIEAVFDDLDTLYAKTDTMVFYVLSGGLPDGANTRDVHLAAARALAAKLP